MSDASLALRPVRAAMSRRCYVCGSGVEGSACSECGNSLTPRTEIGILNGVQNNFGTVQNVYNIAAPAAEPEIVDFRDIQDTLNQRFPERVRTIIPSPMPALPSGPSRTARTLNTMACVWGVVLVVTIGYFFYVVIT